jgi:hypothetical protein
LLDQWFSWVQERFCLNSLWKTRPPSSRIDIKTKELRNTRGQMPPKPHHLLAYPQGQGKPCEGTGDSSRPARGQT